MKLRIIDYNQGQVPTIIRQFYYRLFKKEVENPYKTMKY